MSLKLSNNANGILALAISDSATSLALRAGHGSRFPLLSSGSWFPITVVRASDPSQFEIMHCIARSGDTLTVVRAQEGTSAIAFDAGDVVSLRLTAGTLEENFPQVEGRNAKNLRFIIGSVGGKPELKFKSGNNEETVVRRSDLTTSRTDATLGRVLKVGDFGVGDTISIPQGANLNDYTTPGEYFQSANANAIPELNYPAQLAGTLKVIQAASGVVQEYTTYGNTRRRFLRGLYNGSWSSWVEFYNSGNIAQLISDANLVQTSRTISTGTGLTGGGDLSANRTISIDPNYDASLVKTSRTISTGTGLTGGGNLSANRTISLASSHWPIGVGQTWRNVTGSRSAGTTYTNSTGRPIAVLISLRYAIWARFYVGGVEISYITSTDHNLTIFAIVPPGSTYRLEISGNMERWAELR